MIRNAINHPPFQNNIIHFLLTFVNKIGKISMKTHNSTAGVQPKQSNQPDVERKTATLNRQGRALLQNSTDGRWSNQTESDML
jgi:hypothetical protein